MRDRLILGVVSYNDTTQNYYKKDKYAREVEARNEKVDKRNSKTG